MEMRTKMIKDIKIYDGPEDLGRYITGEQFDSYIFPSKKYRRRPSKTFKDPINFPVSKIIIEYPLRNKAEIIVSGITTLNDLLRDVVEGYQQVYEIEEMSLTEPSSRICDIVPGCSLINRNETNGVFRIWGHALEDLAIEGVWIYENGVKLNVDS